MPSSSARTPDADEIFFTALSNGHSVRAASAMARYSKRSVYRWRGQDADFGSRWAMALEMACDLLEEEADRRGRDGIEVPVFNRGRFCGRKRIYADRLLIARLMAIRPALYRERQMSGMPPVPQPLNVIARDAMLESVLRRLVRGEAIDRTALPARIQDLIGSTDNVAGQ